MSRIDLIAKVKELGINTPKPPHRMKTEDLQTLVKTSNTDITVKEEAPTKTEKPATSKEVVDRKTDSMKSRILKLAFERDVLKTEPKTKERREAVKGLVSTLEEEGWAEKVKCGKVRPLYVKIVLENV